MILIEKRVESHYGIFLKVIVRFIFWSVVTQGHGSWTGKVCLSTKSRLHKVYKGLSLIMEFFPKVSQVHFLGSGHGRVYS